MEIKIYTFADRRPDFIAWQAKTFAHFLQDRYQFIVVNNGSSAGLSQQIAEITQRLGLTHIEVAEKHHENPNVACAYPIDWTLKNYISVDDEARISVIIDSDMFLVRKFSFLDFVGDYEIVALPQRRGHIHYIWNGLVMINHDKIRDLEQISFHCSGCKGFSPFFDEKRWIGSKIEGQLVDVGGAMYFYFRDHPHCKFKSLHSTHHISPERRNPETLPKEILQVYDPEFAFELVEQTFFHYGSGSNWKKQSDEYHLRKTRLAERLIIGVLCDEIEIPRKKYSGNYRDPSFRHCQYYWSARYWFSSQIKRIMIRR